MRAAVFLDRDGVINRAFLRAGVSRPPASLQQLEILPGVADALHALHRHGYALIVVTNQPDVARGACARELVESIHERLQHALPLDAILTCFHDRADQCACRKPQPGLLWQAAREHQIDLTASFMVGDRWSDVEAGRRAGCSTLLLDAGRVDRSNLERGADTCDFRVESLAEAARIILSQPRPPACH